MKILMTTDNIGGVWTYAIELAKGLKKCGDEVFLAVIGNSLTQNQKMELQGIPHSSFSAKQEWMENPWDDVQKAGKWLLQLKQKVKPDVMHFNSYALAALNWQVPIIVTLHSCVLTWWEAVKNEHAPANWQLYRQNISKGIKNADVVVAPSNAMLNAAEKYYGPFLNKKRIYNGRNATNFHAAEKEKFIFSMGRIWDEAKNVKLITEAASKINYPVFIAGKYQAGELTDPVSNVYMLGQLNGEQIADWLSFAAIYLLPAKYEPFGYTFVEAAFSGCALIGGNIGSLREIWNDAMLYADTTNAGKLAEQVNRLMEDEEKLQIMQSRASRHANQFYTTEKMVMKYSMLYKKLVNEKVMLQH